MATLKDIAEAAGVSSMTVSRILNGNAEYNRPSYADRAEKIRRLADRMGYRPNAAAQATVTGRFNAVGVVAVTEGDQVTIPSVPYLRGLVNALAERGVSVTFTVLTEADLMSDASAPHLLRTKMVDGLVLDYSTLAVADRLHELTRGQLPTVLVNDDRPWDAVYPDDSGATASLTDKLFQAGHRRVGFLSGDISGHYSGPARLGGYRKAMAKAGLEPNIMLTDLGSESGVQEIEAWLSCENAPTAVVCIEASNVPLEIAMHKLGLRSPVDLSIVSLVSVSPTSIFNLSHGGVPWFWVGREAGEMLMRKIDDPGCQCPSVSAPLRRYVEGNSIAPPRGRFTD